MHTLNRGDLTVKLYKCNVDTECAMPHAVRCSANAHTLSSGVGVGASGSCTQSQDKVEGKYGRLGEGLLESEGGDGDHSYSAIGDLRIAHRRTVSAKGVKAQHARKVVILSRQRSAQGALEQEKVLMTREWL